MNPTKAIAGHRDVNIDPDRMLARIAALAEISPLPGGGSNRLALTAEDGLARDLVASWMRALGMAVRIDQIGNIIGRRAGRLDLPAVMTGSHIDTVATGGRFDGIYGVVAGLEAVESLNDAGIVTDRPLEVVVFTNEEGSRFKPDVLGSLVYVGGMDIVTALDLRAKDGARLGDDLTAIGYAGDAAVPGIVPHAFIELHVEQGPLLEAEGTTIGAVVDLQGILWLEIEIDGQSNHAGTTPMHLRRDAGYVAARIAAFARDIAASIDGQVATCGAIKLSPGLVNVVPARATLTLDLRNPDAARLAQAEAMLMELISELAASEHVRIVERVLARFEPVVFSPIVVDLVEAHARRLGHSVRRMTSGACHDAQMMARVCPTGMIFVPSVDGISHNPAEYTAPADLAAGAQILFDTMLDLARA